MDVGVIISAVGSFAVSETILKPKATVLIILGCILAYDLTTKTHDTVSLRVYRGPALLAFTLMMCAYSLRTWRRNGVACDELLFLPGTAHGQNHGIDGPLVESPPEQPLPPPIPPGIRTPSSTTTPRQKRHKLKKLTSPPTPGSGSVEMSNLGGSSSSLGSPSAGSKTTVPNEGDVAAGGGSAGGSGGGGTYRSSGHRSATTNSFRNRRPASENEADLAVDEKSLSNNDGNDQESSHHDDTEALLPNSSSSRGPAHPLSTPQRKIRRLQHSDSSLSSFDVEMTSNLAMEGYGNTTNGDDNFHDEDNHDDDEHHTDSEALLGAASHAMHEFGENHPRIVWIGKFFFFRTDTLSASSGQNAAYAPSGPMVFGAALDMCMPVLVNFHMFIEAYNHVDDYGENLAKILPLIFLSVLIVRTVIPPGRRGRFWSTLNFTFTAPMHNVKFRDAFIGDVLTSLVRPGQDVFFALSYYVSVVYGIISGKYGLTRSGTLLEESWLLHNVILPSCAILPLWWKYLQTLRQAYDNNRRWPYQGNSLKYLSATLVVVYGMTHPEDRRSSWWVFFFLLALAYQIWWDVVMDWELFEMQPHPTLIDAASEDSCCSQISSFRPNSTFLLNVQMYILQPVFDKYQRIRSSLPSWRQIQLRPKRLYKTEAFYWKIFVFNLFFRFTWMLCFIPAYHFSADEENTERVTTSSTDVNSYLGVLLPAAEIVRRMCWGFLCLEKETIKMMESDVMYAPVQANDEEDDDGDDETGGLNGSGNVSDDNSKTGIRSFRAQLLPAWLDVQQQVAHDLATTDVKRREFMMRQLFVAEICGWAVAFVLLGCWAAT